MLQVKNLEKTYANGISALKGVSLELAAGQTIGLVGESGCGKSTLAKAICRLEHIDSGRLCLDSKEYTNIKPKQMRLYRKKLQIIFQDSSGSLDPMKTVYESMSIAIDNFFNHSKQKKKEIIIELLEKVALDESFLKKYPHQMSGGERQRIVIARALSLQPEYIICDEPVSSLDNEIKEGIVDLLKQLQIEEKIAYLFISHDIGITMKISGNIKVMFGGMIVEELESSKVLTKARHPYTRMLINCDPKVGSCCCGFDKQALEAKISSRGCPYFDQCCFKTEICAKQRPTLTGKGSHKVACHHPVEA